MDPPSLIRATNQAWKLHVGTLMLLIAAPVTVWGCIELLQNGNYRVLLAGLLIGLFALAFCSLTIRCPNCGAHWYWRSLKTLQFGWAKRLVRQAECGVCGYRGEK